MNDEPLDLYFEELKPKTTYVRAVPKGSDPDTSDLELVLALEPEGDALEVNGAKGDLSDQVNIEIGLYALKRGFKCLKFSVVKGRKVSRWARPYLTHSTEKHDCYRVPLLRAAKELGL